MNNINLIIKPDEEDFDAAEVLVEGWIGEKKYSFLLDTGAARTSIEYDSYTKTLNRIEQNTSAGVFAKSSYDIVQIPSIKLGPIIKNNICISRDIEGKSHKRNLIGMDVLKEHKLCFYFDKNIVVVNQEDMQEDNLAIIALELGDKFHPYVQVKLENTEAKAVWDTGAGITIADINFVKGNPKNFKLIGQSVGTDSTGTESETPMYLMTDINIGGYSFEAHRVAAIDLSHVNSNTTVAMDMILGYTTLSKANWYFDFPNKKWAIIDILSGSAK